MRWKRIFLPGALALLVLGLAVWGWMPRGLPETDAALAVLNVENLSCGACVRNIQEALDGIDGIGRVEVSVTAGRGEVEFDQQRIDAAQIARRITAAGYPAKIRETLSAADYQALKAENSKLASIYVARIGKRLLPRDEFEQAVRLQLSSLPQSASAEARARVRLQVWDQLRQRELLLGAAEAKQVVVQDGEVDLEIQKLKAGHSGFDQQVEKQFGGLEAVSRQIKNNLIIRRFLAQNVVAPDMPEPQRQLALQQWYQQLVDATPVVIFDPALKAAAGSAGSGCGGSCCS